jgi:hypothetical protein
MHIFHVNVAVIEKENISVLELQQILSSVFQSLDESHREQFIPMKVRSKLNSLSENGYQREVDQFKERAQIFYSKCTEYLEKWSKPLEEFKSVDATK